MIIKLTNEMEELIKNALNIDNRNIVIAGQIGSGKTTFLRYIRRLCSNNTLLVDPETDRNIGETIRNNMFNSSMGILAGQQNTLVVDEVRQLFMASKEVMQDCEGLYYNFIITTHSNGNTVESRLIDDEVKPYVINKTDPVILYIKRYLDGTRTVMYVDNNREILGSKF